MITYSGDRALETRLSRSRVSWKEGKLRSSQNNSQNIYLNTLNFSVISQKTQYTVFKDQ